MLFEEEKKDNNIIIDVHEDQEEAHDDSPLDEFEEEEDDNDFLNETPKENRESYLETSPRKEVSEPVTPAVNNDSLIDPNNEKLLFEKLGKYFINLTERFEQLLAPLGLYLPLSLQNNRNCEFPFPLSFLKLYDVFRDDFMLLRLWLLDSEKYQWPIPG